MIYSHLITPRQLYESRQSDWAIFDCSFDLSNPAWGLQKYRESHLPEAMYAHLENDLSGLVNEQSGRHPLPDPDIFARKLTVWGIRNQTQVVVYDTKGGSFAGRLWWLLRFYGHDKVAVLNGGFSSWLHDLLPIQKGDFNNLPATTPFVPSLHPEMMVSVEEVANIYRDPAYLLIDARTPIRFRGENEPIDPVAGHIPGARNRFHGENLTAEGLFKSPSTLNSEFTQLLGDTRPENSVVYCGSGVTSCLHILAMEIAGYKGVRLYPGSWSEWISDPARPVAIGG